MTIRNCSRCGRMFQATAGETICARCRDTDEEDFKVVREYIYDNPNANIPEVAEETGISEEKILKFLRQGRLLLKDENSMVLDCERCGKAIRSGRFCDSCTAEMSNQLRSAATATAKQMTKESESLGRGMYTKNSGTKK